MDWALGGPVPAALPQRASDASGAPESGAEAGALGRDRRFVATSLTVRELFDAHYEFVWRSVRRLGLSTAESDDAAQSVFIIAARKQEMIAVGKERAFLFGTAVRVVADVRKSAARRLSVPDDSLHVPDPSVGTDVRIDEARARDCLEEAIRSMPLDLSTAFVLHELEELTMVQIAEMLGIPPGTVASRIRRAREHFEQAMIRLRGRFGGAG